MPNQDIEPPARDPLSGVPFRIGIVGGMGPLAGVYLQQLIIEATPARKDQDHFQVVCFTNPHVPERMRSLAEDGGRRYAEAVRASARLLVGAGVSHIVIPCNTAHARLAEIQRGVDVPIVNMVELALQALVAEHGRGQRVGLLATVGTIEQRVYQDGLPGAALEWVLPDEGDQRRVSEAILAVKVNEGPRVADGPARRGPRAGRRGAPASSWSDAPSCRCAWTRCGPPGCRWWIRCGFSPGTSWTSGSGVGRSGAARGQD